MELTKYTLFANHTATGSIYNTVIYDTENAKSIRFWFEGPINAGVGASASIFFDHSLRASGPFEPFTGVVLLGAGGGSISSLSLRSSAILASGIVGSFATGYVYPLFMPNCLQVRYELSGVAASASAGTVSAYLSVERENI